MAKHFFMAATLEDWLANDRMSPPGCMSPDEKAIKDKIIAGNYQGPTNWYRILTSGLGVEEEIQDRVDPNIHCRTLFLVGAAESAAPPEVSPFAKDYTSKRVPSGHFVQLEAKDEVNEILEAFIARMP